MKWIWVLVTIIGSTFGDLLNARGMTDHGEIVDLGPRGLARTVRYMVTHPMILGGMICNAISFGGFLALLSTSELSFAVPATALSYLLKTGLAHIFLGERVSWRRWAGAVLVAIGVALISL